MWSGPNFSDGYARVAPPSNGLFAPPRESLNAYSQRELMPTGAYAEQDSLMPFMQRDSLLPSRRKLREPNFDFKFVDKTEKYYKTQQEGLLRRLQKRSGKSKGHKKLSKTKSAGPSKTKSNGLVYAWAKESAVNRGLVKDLNNIQLERSIQMHQQLLRLYTERKAKIRKLEKHLHKFQKEFSNCDRWSNHHAAGLKKLYSGIKKKLDGNSNAPKVRKSTK